MAAKTQHDRIITGLKFKQLRQAKGMSFSELSQCSGLSVSYLNEIEKGKKYPKEEKMDALLAALGTTRAELESPLFHKNLAPVTELLESNFLNELPLELYGIDLAKVVELIAGAPTQVGAFISTLLEISRNYALREENFYFAALRSYLELNQNYFQEIEDAAAAFTAEFNIPDSRPISPEMLKRLLETEYGYVIHEGGLDSYTELRHLRAVFVPARKTLLLNSNLSANQRAFQFGKELGFQYLKVQQRAVTSSLLRGLSFEEVLNHARATYFSDALLLPLEPFVRDFREFAASPRWDGALFLEWMKRYGATPEMFYHRLTNVLPKFFGLDQLFFMRFVHDPEHGGFEVDRELQLSKRHKPHGNGLKEHYCRRWLSVSLLKDLQRLQQEGKSVDTMVKAQRMRFADGGEEYLCFTIARTSYPAPNRNVSVTLGLLVNEVLRRRLQFLEDQAITIREVGNTCERCPIVDCAERAALPVVVERRRRSQRIQQQLAEIQQS